MMKELLSALQADPAYVSLADTLRGGTSSRAKSQTHINLIGPCDPQKALLLAALSADCGLRPFVLAPDELAARAIAAALSAFLGEPVRVFRQRELGLADAEASSHEGETARIGILADLLDGTAGAVVATAAAALQKLPPVELFRAAVRTLAAGAAADPDELADHLAAIGYERVRQAEGPGQFARRGDILDIVPPGEDSSGIRLSFFDTEIDAVKRFDPATQRSTEMLSSIRIPPAREILLDADARRRAAALVLAAGRAHLDRLASEGADTGVREQIRRMVERDAERLEHGLSFAACDRWLPLLYEDAASVVDYALAAGATIFVDEPSRVSNRLDAAQADLAERIKTLLLKGHVLPLAVDIAWRGTDILRRLDASRRVVSLAGLASSGNGFPGAREFRIAGRTSESYRGREDRLTQEIQRRNLAGLSTWLMADTEERADRLRRLLAEADTHAHIRTMPLPTGLEYMACGLLVIGSQDIFGNERRARRMAHKGARIDLFSDLSPGDYVVHEAHGIGRYEGLHAVESGGVRRDYLRIAYAAEDTLYIPMESLDQIQKYVGSEGREPRLTRLGGQEWTRMKERAREAIRKLATDLVALYARRRAMKGHAFSPDTVWQKEFEDTFPYEETEDQLRCIAEVKADMESDSVMDRLLCGDVGFGKTEVAFRAMFKAVMDGKQVALLAPTTVLAQQHYENFIERVKGFPVEVGLLSRFAPEALQKKTIRGLASGKVDVVIATHRLLSKDVRFKDLGLLVVDEEQRFGVDHKEMLKAIAPETDVLTLSATPIPRTLHMSLSGIRDISMIEEPPPDRRSVQTYVMEYEPDMVAEAMLREISRDGQVFYLFNDTRRILDKVAEIERSLPGARISYGHGKMGERTLENVIEGFIAGEADVLVCTTIIESGIDMPNVNTIIIEDADRLGLSSLYQLRGRVGRSGRQAYAYVTYRRDKVITEVAQKRLAAIRDFTELGSGLKIALRDLEVRGAGNLLGGEQHGQLEAIGYDLYCRMLDDAIKTMHEESGDLVRPPRKTATTVEIEVDAYIPSAYVPDEAQRMDMYRRVASIDGMTAYADVLDELIDRYGDLPHQVVTLADISAVRALASRFAFKRVYTQRDAVILACDEENPAA
ncbi:MAG TPA: transcription-repair coupling factor, partial [Clostridia bacterium]